MAAYTPAIPTGRRAMSMSPPRPNGIGSATICRSTRRPAPTRSSPAFSAPGLDAMLVGKALLPVIVALALLIPSRPAGTVPGHMHLFDFTGFPGGSVLKWLQQKGFVPKQDATSP